MNAWKRKVRALTALIEDRPDTPEGDVARAKLAIILERHSVARDYGPTREFMLSDLYRMKMDGVSTEGSWTGVNLEDAIAKMTADFEGRMRAKAAGAPKQITA